MAYYCLKKRHMFTWAPFSLSPTFTFMHLADAFIQSDLQCIQVIYFFCQYACSLGIEPTTFALLTQCSNHWATGRLFFHSLSHFGHMTEKQVALFDLHSRRYTSLWFPVFTFKRQKREERLIDHTAASWRSTGHIETELGFAPLGQCFCRSLCVCVYGRC